MNNRQKDWIYSVISDVGYKCTPKSYMANVKLSYRLREMLDRFKVTSVLDVGANIGQYRNFLRRRCGYKGRILSFEPARATFETLQKNAKGDGNWEVYNFALGSADEERTFNVMKDTVFNSFLSPRSIAERPNWDTMNAVDKKETVRVRRLDTVLREMGGQPHLERIYLKLDTQGHDLEVLKGAGNALDRVAALQSEVSIQPIYEGMPGYLDTVSEVKRLGFEISGFFEVTSDRFFRAIEFDCVAINYTMVSKLNSGAN